MKKRSIVVVALLVAGLSFYQPVVNAQSENETTMEQNDTTNFIKSSGLIKEIETKDGIVTLTVESEEIEPQITMFKLNDETFMFNSESTKAVEKEAFQKGQRIDAYYDKNKPMIMIYPAQIYPELVIVHDEEKIGSVKVSKFDEELLSLDKELKLNIGEETLLVNEKGEELEQADLNGKELVVFYTITTMSIPAQTPPTKVIALNNLSPEMKEVQTIIEKDYFDTKRNENDSTEKSRRAAWLCSANIFKGQWHIPKSRE